MERKIAVIGLGYVGLPVALAFARKYPGTFGFDINEKRVSELASGVDSNRETPDTELKESKIRFTSVVEDLRGTNFFVVAVPTPVTVNNAPDLRALIAASETVGKVIQRGGIVVFESTVYPGVTEEICGPAVARVSGLRQGVDFKLGYSPERINPGDHKHRLETIIKVVSGEDQATLAAVADCYGGIVQAGVHRAPSIKVAEAAKVIENTQRDLNIALMNELAIIFDRMDISTKDVLDAAATKWNFVKFTPGLVGGHCIGVDPYYLTAKAEQLGYYPRVILAGRRINDGMGVYVAQRLVKLMSNNGLMIRDAKIGILGLTFKENVSDLRNSRVPDIIQELKQFGVNPIVHDPVVDPHDAQEEFGIKLADFSQLQNLDAVVLAVSHDFYLEKNLAAIKSCVRAGGVFIDVKSVLRRSDLPETVTYWSL